MKQQTKANGLDRERKRKTRDGPKKKKVLLYPSNKCYNKGQVKEFRKTVDR